MIVGDPFSGGIQLIIGITRASEVKIIDAGTATLEFPASGSLVNSSPGGTTSPHRANGARYQLARGRVANSARRQLSPKVGATSPLHMHAG